MAGAAVRQQRGITDAVLIELKAVRAFDRAYRAQCINDLRAIRRHLCLPLNFGTLRTIRVNPRPFVFICVTILLYLLDAMHALILFGYGSNGRR